MHLSSLTLINVRQFENRTFEFEPGFNLLIGENGAGKTTILRGLLAALAEKGSARSSTRLTDEDIRLDVSRSEIRATVVAQSGQKDEFRYEKEFGARAVRSPRGKVRPRVLLYSANEASCPAMKVKKLTRSGEDRALGLRRSEDFLYEIDREMSLPRSDSVAGVSRFGNSKSVKEFIGRVLALFSEDFSDFYWRFEPYDCTVVAPIDASGVPIDAKLQKRAKAFAMRFFQEEWKDRRARGPIWPDAQKLTLDTAPSRNKKRGGRLPSTHEIWTKAGISTEDQKSLAGCSLAVKLAPRIMIQHQAGFLRLSQLSDGEQRLFSLFVDIARQLLVGRNDGRIDPDAAIVVIDEIDVHLHPKWQRIIIPALEDLFEDCQFIATTHSPFVIQAADRQKITAINPADSVASLDGGNSIEDIVEGIQGISVPQRSVRAKKLGDAAEVYFKLLKRVQSKDLSIESPDFVTAELLYREASEAFSTDPAVHALLKVQLMEGRSQ